jgi:hypothetical protein
MFLLLNPLICAAPEETPVDEGFTGIQSFIVSSVVIKISNGQSEIKDSNIYSVEEVTKILEEQLKAKKLPFQNLTNKSVEQLGSVYKRSPNPCLLEFSLFLIKNKDIPYIWVFRTTVKELSTVDRNNLKYLIPIWSYDIQGYTAPANIKTTIKDYLTESITELSKTWHKANSVENMANAPKVVNALEQLW